MTERQIWAMKRNWLLLRLKGARSIFSSDNVAFISKELVKGKRNKRRAYDCIEAIDDLIDVVNKSVYYK